MRLVVAERVVPMRELMDEWSVEDVWDAHIVLDLKEDAALKAARKSAATRPPRKGGR